MVPAGSLGTRAVYLIDGKSVLLEAL